MIRIYFPATSALFTDGMFETSPFNLTPKFSRSSAICFVPCNSRFTPRGRPRHDAKLIEFKHRQLMRISLTASNETDDPQRFKWLKLNDEKMKWSNRKVNWFSMRNFKTHFNGDSAPFSAIALIALSNGSCTFAHAKSNSVRLCAHFEAINSSPDLLDRRNQRMRYFEHFSRLVERWGHLPNVSRNRAAGQK